MSQPDQDNLHALRHSMAHIMATAIQHLWPKAKFGVGPVVEKGFYYDIDLGKAKLGEEDFNKIEAEMHKIVAADQPFERSLMPIDKAITWAKANHQPYKEELLNDLKRAGTTLAKDLDKNELGTVADGKGKISQVSFYTNGDFTDLCRGPHVASTGKVGYFKLMRVSGAYWRGKETNPQMQRIYGVAFASKDELKDHLTMLVEADKRDHRKLGKELDLFVISPLVGAGLPLFTPRGTVLRDELNRYSQELRFKEGYETVWTPHIAKQVLYETSGHWAKFGDEWLKIVSQETKDNLVMKPMNCPHHQQIYASRPRSYRDLPIKYMETTTDYRDEKAGELLGLARVRAITQDDSHVFCTPEQIEDVIKKLVEIVQKFYEVLDLPLKVRLSFRDDADSYLGDKALWDKAQSILRKIVQDTGLDYYEGIGEAAFYGPKIDFMGQDAVGRELQLATPQLDFVQPERFGLSYVDQSGKEKTPVMIHFALLGSIERFLAAYIEHTAGKFPVWLAPEQVRVVTVNQDQPTIKFAELLKHKASALGVRLGLDTSNQSIGKKIREAEVWKVPYTVVVGDKEIKGGQLMPRLRHDLVAKTSDPKLSADDFLNTVAVETKNRMNKSSL
jgi:threonyl-tRNA synthetase